MENNKQCVFIFEHKGSKSDNSEYPQCELITPNITIVRVILTGKRVPVPHAQ